MCYMQIQNYSDLFYTYTQVPFLRQHKLSFFSYSRMNYPNCMCCGEQDAVQNAVDQSC